MILQATSSTQSSGDASVDAEDEDGLFVGAASAFVDPEFGPTAVRDGGILDGPGAFTLNAESNGADYEVLVCETGGTGGGGGGGRNDQYTEPTTAPPPVSPPTDDPSLFVSGGPEEGPTPKMPGGGCPPEYPVKKEGVCWAS